MNGISVAKKLRQFLFISSSIERSMLYKFECSFESECIASTGAVVTRVPRTFQPRCKGHPRLNRSQIYSDSKNNLRQLEDIIP